MNDELIEALAAVTAPRWKLLTTEMSWVYRRMKLGAVGEVPPSGEHHFTKLPSEQEWAKIRKAVTTKRKNDRGKQARALAKAQSERKREKQREYMRSYRARQQAL